MTNVSIIAFFPVIHTIVNKDSLQLHITKLMQTNSKNQLKSFVQNVKSYVCF